MTRLKIVFFGTPEFAAPFLDSLLADPAFEVALAVTAPDKPAGRKQILASPVVKQIAAENKIPVIQSEDPEEWEKEIGKISPDFLAVAAFGKIIPKSVLDLAKSGAINVHPSLLPQLRGASPIQSAILSGADETGIAIMLMDEKMDHGPILKQEKIRLQGNETSESLSQELALKGVPLLKQVLKNFFSIVPLEQDHAKATFCKIIAKETAKIDWKRSAKEIERQIRAFFPWPIAWTMLDGRRLKIFPLASVMKESKKPGEIFLSGKDMAVGCGLDSLVLGQIQMAGKKEMKGQDFLRGYSAAGKTLS